MSTFRFQYNSLSTSSTRSGDPQMSIKDEELLLWEEDDLEFDHLYHDNMIGRQSSYLRERRRCMELE